MSLPTILIGGFFVITGAFLMLTGVGVLMGAIK